MAFTFNLSTQEEEAGRSLYFEASLLYRGSSGTAKATQRDSRGRGWECGAYQLKALTALVEDLSTVPSLHARHLTTACNSS